MSGNQKSLPRVTEQASLLMIEFELPTATADIKTNFNAQVRVFAADFRGTNCVVGRWRCVVFNGCYEVAGFDTCPDHAAEFRVANEVYLLGRLAILDRYRSTRCYAVQTYTCA